MRHRALSQWLVVVATGSSLALASPAETAPMFMGLGDLPGGIFNSQALAVSADGSTVVGRGSTADATSGFTEAFRWTQTGGMVGLGLLPVDLDPNLFGRGSNAYAVTADGSTVVGWSETGPSVEGFRWTSDGGMVGLGDLPGGGSNSYAYGISADGSVVVGEGTSAGSVPNQAFRLTLEGGMVGLGDLPGGSFDSSARAISADGTVIVGVGHNSASNVEGFRWTSEGGMVPLGDLPGGPFDSEPTAVSPDGSVIVGISRSASGLEAFRWTSEGGIVGLGDLPGGSFSSEAFAVSADGSIVLGTSADSSGQKGAFIWDPSNGMRPLDQVLMDLGIDLATWRLVAATGISADGLTIVGYGSNPDGDVEGWIAVIPEPNTGVLMMMGLLELAYRRRRHGRAAKATRL
jgi:probable HAF family extracellular repeat protein